MDWREMRARLVQQEKAEAGSSSNEVDGYVYESPLIEQGSVILGGTMQDFGFALRQQYFHKSVMLLLQHDEGFTKGIILNRPSAYEIDGWRVWFGGDVGEGDMFRGSQESKGEREIICLHALDGELAERLSMSVIKGVSYTSLQGAQALVSDGVASRSDFWVFVGYAGWAPRQLQGEVERNSWFLASADSGTLLKELLRQGTGLPPPSSGVVPGDGLSTWETLMASIGRSEEVERTRGSLADRMLSEWCRVRLVPPLMRGAQAAAQSPPAEQEEAGAVPQLPMPVGTVLCSGEPSDRALLSDQFLHKSILLTIHKLPDGICVAIVLNRPTANLVQFHTEGKPRRCISFGGDGRLRAPVLDLDSNGLMWLSQVKTLGALELGRPVGDSGLKQVPAQEAADSIKDGSTELSDYLLVSGLVCFGQEELETMFRSGEMHVVKDASSVWPQVWDLSDPTKIADEKASSSGNGAALSDGTGAWWAARLLGKQESRQSGKSRSDPGTSSASFDALLSGLQAMPPAHLADEALAEWLKFFAGHADEPRE
jgi:putative AlgH/UPF0301 family transcriptional regulator